MLLGVTVAAVAGLLGCVYVASYVAVFTWTISTRPRSLADMPFWVPAASILSGCLMFTLIAYGIMRLWLRFSGRKRYAATDN